MSLVLAGFGTALPEYHVIQQDALEIHRTFFQFDETQARILRALYRRSGVVTRHSVLLDKSGGPIVDRQSFYAPAVDENDLGPATRQRMAVYEEEAPVLVSEAARRALVQASIDASEVTHLITVSCTGFVSPGVDAAIIRAVDLPRTVERTNVGFMGCHGSLNGLRVARSFTDADPKAVPLVCSVELCTLHFAYGWDPDMIVANALFSDGAAAVVGRSDAQQVGDGGEEGDRCWRVTATGTLLMDDSEEDMTWRVGDHGFRMTLSARVPDLIERHLGGWLTEWLRRQGLGLEDVRSWAVHPGGPRILNAVEKTLGLSQDDTAVSRAVLSECGNMSSVTILFILDRMRAAAAPRPCVALAFGPGLVVEAVLLS